MQHTSDQAQNTITAKNVDLSNCDRELVQFSGAVQPHCALLVLAEPDLRILQTSANSEELLGLPAQELLGRTISALLDPGEEAELRAKIARHPLKTPNHIFRASFHGLNSHVFAHRVDGLLLLEFENSFGEAELPLEDLYSELRNHLSALEATPSLRDFFQLTVQQIRDFTGFDRVLAYQFLPDKSGKVIAEAKQDGAETYLGLHYPASDIPEPARRLFSMLWLRHLPNTSYTPSPILPELNPVTSQPVDLSLVAGRSVSKMYSQYLINMGVQASMVITLLKNGQLWGLISCMHHQAPRLIPYDVRIACEFLGHMVSFIIGSKEEELHRGRIIGLRDNISPLIDQMSRSPVFYRGLLVGGVTALSILDCGGAAVVVEKHVYTLGDCPAEAEIQHLTRWLDERITDNTVFSTDRLPSLLSRAERYKNQASGLLAIRLGMKKRFALWFRPEILKSVDWAGDPHKPVEVENDSGETRLTPRNSFNRWKAQVSGTAEPWSEYEVRVMQELQRSIIEMVAHRAEHPLSVNRELILRNLELDSFAFGVSHDLKESLRGIHNFSALILRKTHDSLDADSQAKLKTIQRLARRMDELIEALLHYSRVGRTDMAFIETDLNVILTHARDMLATRFAERETELTVPTPLPTISCDPICTGELFVNLLSNALKYNDKPVRRIEIGWQDQERLTFWVRDNGIGIAPEHREEVFRIFRRIHARDEHGGGAGAGLTIARRIVERHGGGIWLESTPGVCTTVFFTFPAERRAPNHAARLVQ